MTARRIRRTVRIDRPGLTLDADVNAVIATGHSDGHTVSRITQRRHTPMTDRLPQPADQDPRQLAQSDELSPDELERQEGEELPDREAMSLINANVAAPVNAAVALNALSDGSTAYADAVQEGHITQTN